MSEKQRRVNWNDAQMKRAASAAVDLLEGGKTFRGTQPLIMAAQLEAFSDPLLHRRQCLAPQTRKLLEGLIEREKERRYAAKFPEKEKREGSHAALEDTASNTSANHTLNQPLTLLEKLVDIAEEAAQAAPEPVAEPAPTVAPHTDLASALSVLAASLGEAFGKAFGAAMGASVRAAMEGMPAQQIKLEMATPEHTGAFGKLFRAPEKVEPPTQDVRDPLGDLPTKFRKPRVTVIGLLAQQSNIIRDKHQDIDFRFLLANTPSRQIEQTSKGSDMTYTMRFIDHRVTNHVKGRHLHIDGGLDTLSRMITSKFGTLQDFSTKAAVTAT